MALLEVENLTMRFGGLTAVQQLNLSVESGQIFSIIGPNGAGKTTAFNVITGIYEPTEGTIKLDGREEGLPLTWWRVVCFILIGLVTGLACFLISIDVDTLWKRTIKRNMADTKAQPFTYANAWRDALAYLHGELIVEQGRYGIWSVTTADGRRELGTANTEEEAQALREQLDKIIALGGSDATLEQRNGQWVILSADRTEVLATYASAEEARTQLQQLAEVAAGRQRLQRIAWSAFFAGLGVGAFGSLAIWWRTRRSPEVIARGGVARTFQNIRLFQNMTVMENVLVGMDRSLPAGWWGVLTILLGLKTREAECCQRAGELLRYVGLAAKGGELAKNLPYGDQRRLEIARALGTRPQLLLLDEPAAGMNPSETGGLMALIGRIREQGITILLIEHHMNIVMAISDRIAVLDHGVKIAEGTADEVRQDPAVIEAYLGKEEVA